MKGRKIINIWACRPEDVTRTLKDFWGVPILEPHTGTAIQGIFVDPEKIASGTVEARRNLCGRF